MATWWNTSYLFRREITVTSGIGTSPIDSRINLFGSSVSLDYDALETNGSVRSDQQDVEVVHETNDATPSYTVLGRTIQFTGESGSQFWQTDFKTNVAIPDTGKFYVYYGNATLTNQPSRPVHDTTNLIVLPDGLGVSYTRPDEHWIGGASFTPNSVATFSFFGQTVVVLIEKGPNMGKFTYSREDGILIDTLDLYAAELSDTDDERFSLEVTYTTIDFHTISIVVAGERNPSSSDQVVKIKEFQYEGGSTGSFGAEETNITTWTSYTGTRI